MGQLLSRQAAPNKQPHRRDSSLPRSHRPRHEKAQYGAIGHSRTLPKSVHWDTSSARRSKTTGTKGSRPRLNVLNEVDGNVGAPRRQPKYGRGKTSTESVRIKSGGHQHARRSDSQQAKARVKGDHLSKPSASNSNLHQKKSQQTKECIICTDARSLRRFPNRPPTDQCSHDSDACRRCLRTWIESESSTKIWNEINCPICAARMDYNDIREFAPSEVFRRYDNLTTKAKYDAIPNHRWCIAKNCKAGQVHPPGTAKFRCKTCKKTHCVVHGVMWHKGETCQEYDYRTNKHIKKAEEAASKDLIAATTKKCPGCKRSIEKDFGCDHMTCSKCKHEFCWQCLATYAKKGTRRVVHRQGCAYYDPEWDAE
ncbi:hypothetical protein CC86DRAFT_68760 [Ophiobolus disseminans]|uniref:RBR-type E3 ubiquitin transferase n=1 Tax=Ophiobolus disseminans TaxID=1469910 RepID=A0A6A6ZT38_9PLEO|nr:hypothetical protein CC86DRAFT_68760 [Ophiobolus disseminans]